MPEMCRSRILRKIQIHTLGATYIRRVEYLRVHNVRAYSFKYLYHDAKNTSRVASHRVSSSNARIFERNLMRIK